MHQLSPAYVHRPCARGRVVASSAPCRRPQLVVSQAQCRTLARARSPNARAPLHALACAPRAARAPARLPVPRTQRPARPACELRAPRLRPAQRPTPCYNTVPCIAIQIVPSQPTSIAIQYQPLALQPQSQYNHCIVTFSQAKRPSLLQYNFLHHNIIGQ